MPSLNRASLQNRMSPHVTVARDELADALKQLAKFVRGKARVGDAVIARDDDGLTIETAGQTAGVAAVGAWTGQVRVPARFLLAIAARLPKSDTVAVRVSGGRLHVGSISATCIWEEQCAPQIEVPLDPPLTLVLGMAHRYSAEDIVRSGKRGLLEDAQRQRDRLVLRAAEALRPLGVSTEDVLDLVDQVVARLNPR